MNQSPIDQSSTYARTVNACNTHLSPKFAPLLQLDFDARFVTCIVLGLISVTIAFEYGKHSLEEGVTEDMEPIIEKLFGEMTVLGFLSMVSFLMNAAGFFHFLSKQLFGNEEYVRSCRRRHPVVMFLNGF